MTKPFARLLGITAALAAVLSLGAWAQEMTRESGVNRRGGGLHELPRPLGRRLRIGLPAGPALPGLHVRRPRRGLLSEGQRARRHPRAEPDLGGEAGCFLEGTTPAEAIPAGAAAGAASARNGGSTTTAATTPAPACAAWTNARTAAGSDRRCVSYSYDVRAGRVLPQGPRRRPAEGRGQDRRHQGALPLEPGR